MGHALPGPGVDAVPVGIDVQHTGGQLQTSILGVPPQKNGELLPGDDVAAAEGAVAVPCGDALLGAPGRRVGVIVPALHIGEGAPVRRGGAARQPP